MLPKPKWRVSFVTGEKKRLILEDETEVLVDVEAEPITIKSPIACIYDGNEVKYVRWGEWPAFSEEKPLYVGFGENKFIVKSGTLKVDYVMKED